MEEYAVGFDFGSLSVRGLLVNVQTGEELCAAVYDGEGDGALPHLDDDAVRQAAGDGNVLDVWKRGLDVADGQRLIDGQEIVAGLDLRGLDDLLGRIDCRTCRCSGSPTCRERQFPRSRSRCNCRRPPRKLPS